VNDRTLEGSATIEHPLFFAYRERLIFHNGGGKRTIRALDGRYWHL
jgi:hypothetical protein